MKHTPAVTLAMIGVTVLSSACQLDNRTLSVALDGPVDASSTDSVDAPRSDLSPNSRPRGLGEECYIAFPGSAEQTDDCAPGLICLNDGCGSRCYQFCKTDADCFISTCTGDAGGGVKVCDVQSVACNPVTNDPMECPGGVEGCYLSATTTDRTLCDCPFQAGPTNSSCSISQDCFPGLVCVDITGIGHSICRPVCDLTAGASGCPAATCVPLNGSKKYGFCN